MDQTLTPSCGVLCIAPLLALSSPECHSIQALSKPPAHLKEKISFERKHVNPGEFAYNQFSDQLRVDFCDNGRPPTKKIVYFRALPESGGGPCPKVLALFLPSTNP